MGRGGASQVLPLQQREQKGGAQVLSFNTRHLIFSHTEGGQKVSTPLKGGMNNFTVSKGCKRFGTRVPPPLVINDWSLIYTAV